MRPSRLPAMSRNTATASESRASRPLRYAASVAALRALGRWATGERQASAVIERSCRFMAFILRNEMTPTTKPTMPTGTAAKPNGFSVMPKWAPPKVSGMPTKSPSTNTFVVFWMRRTRSRCSGLRPGAGAIMPSPTACWPCCGANCCWGGNCWYCC